MAELLYQPLLRKIGSRGFIFRSSRTKEAAFTQVPAGNKIVYLTEHPRLELVRILPGGCRFRKRPWMSTSFGKTPKNCHAQYQTGSGLRRHGFFRRAGAALRDHHPRHTGLGYWTSDRRKGLAPGLRTNRRRRPCSGPSGHIWAGIVDPGGELG